MVMRPGEAPPITTEPQQAAAAAAAAGPAQAGASAAGAAGEPAGAATMRLQKLVQFAGLTVELFEDMQEVRHPV